MDLLVILLVLVPEELAKENLPVTAHSSKRRGRPQQSWKNQLTDFMKSRNMEEDMAEDRHLWGLGVDGRLLALWILV